MYFVGAPMWVKGEVSGTSTRSLEGDGADKLATGCMERLTASFLSEATRSFEDN